MFPRTSTTDRALNRTLRRLLLCLLFASLGACDWFGCSDDDDDDDVVINDDDTQPDDDDTLVDDDDTQPNDDDDIVIDDALRLMLERDAGAHYFDAPWPSDSRVLEDGRADLSGWPNPTESAFIADNLPVVQENIPPGFASSGGIYLRFTAPLDESTLPDEPAETLWDDSPVQLIDIDPDSPETGRRIPLMLEFYPDGAIFLPENTLAAIPVPGRGLREATTYALVVTTEVSGLLGDPLHPMSDPPVFDGARAAEEEAAWNAAYDTVATYLGAEGVLDPAAVGAATVFTTQDTTADMFRIYDYLLDHYEPPQPMDLVLTGESPDGDYWLVEGDYVAPNLQHGELPYNTPGSGGFVFDENGDPVVAFDEAMDFAMAIPIGEMPAAGWPVVLYGHGTGGDRFSAFRNQTADRLARRGVALIGINQPLHENRYDTDVGATLFYNFANIIAALDNTRQAAVDFILLTSMARTAQIPAAFSPEGKPVRFDPERVMYMGHSQGGFTGPLFVGIEDRLIGAELSGAGGGMAVSILTKTKPFNVKDVAAAILGIQGKEEIDFFHPVAALVQLFLDRADPVYFAPYFIDRAPEGSAKSVLMTIGLLDEHVSFDVSHALACAIGLNPVGIVEKPYPCLTLTGYDPLPSPVEGNRIAADGTTVTAGILQYPEEEHWPVFRDIDAQTSLATFLETLAYEQTPDIVDPREELE